MNCGFCHADHPPGTACGGEDRDLAGRLRAKARDEDLGLYEKFIVRRTDGSSGPGGKHENCPYFVLDLEHDKHAKAALRAYARSCGKEFPLLARDLLELLRPAPKCGCKAAARRCSGRDFARNMEKPKFGG